MRTLARVVLGTTLTAVAFTAGRHTTPPDHPRPLDLAGPDVWAKARVTSFGGGDGPARYAPERYELVPYRVLIDGKVVYGALDAEPRAGDIWQIDLAEDRIVILAFRPSIARAGGVADDGATGIPVTPDRRAGVGP